MIVEEEIEEKDNRTKKVLSNLLIDLFFFLSIVKIPRTFITRRIFYSCINKLKKITFS